MAGLVACVMITPSHAETLIGKMTGAECIAKGGVPVSIIPTTGENPDPVRACFSGSGQQDSPAIQPSWLCSDGKTPVAAAGPCP